MGDTLLDQRFSWLHEGEVIRSFHRRHPYALALHLLFPAFLLALPAALWVVAPSLASFRFLSIAWLILGPLAALLFLWFYLDWLNDYYLVTDRRVVHVEKVMLLYEERREAMVERIQNVSLAYPNPVARLLGFGDLVVETAGGEGRMLLRYLPQPEAVREEILAQMGRSLHPSVGAEAVRGEAAAPPRKGFLSLLGDYLFPRMWLREGSTVTWRKHWYVLLRKTAGVMLLLVLVVEVGLASALDLPLFSFLPRSSILALSVTVASLLALFLLYQYEDWRNDIYVLTDDRIIDIDKKPLLLREERREASLAMVQDVRYVVPGMFYNLFNVGRVIIETAATEGEFTFDWVHDPRRVQEEIFARLDAFRERGKQEEREERAAELREILEAYRKDQEE